MSWVVKNPRNEWIGTWTTQNFWNFKNRSSLKKVTAPRRPSSFGKIREIPRFSSRFPPIFLQKLSIFLNLRRKVFLKVVLGVWTVCSVNWCASIKIKSLWSKILRFSIFWFFLILGSIFSERGSKKTWKSMKIPWNSWFFDPPFQKMLPKIKKKIKKSKI